MGGPVKIGTIMHIYIYIIYIYMYIGLYQEQLFNVVREQRVPDSVPSLSPCVLCNPALHRPTSSRRGDKSTRLISTKVHLACFFARFFGTNQPSVLPSSSLP
jgi:hypothetical protein